MRGENNIIKWIDTRIKLPDLDAAYVISITKGIYTFKAVAFFEEGQWFYSLEGEKGLQITDQINGWVENLGVYIR